MGNDIRKLLVGEIAESLEIPNSAYEAAERRYRDIGEWLQDHAHSRSASFTPHVFPQGSFRLGTVTQPWKREDYDLDLACKLKEGLTKSTHTQEQLKQLVGDDLEKYRIERGIQEQLEEKRRCWRLNYHDQIKFHMDIIPGIPEEETSRLSLQEQMVRAGTAEMLAQDVANFALAITDNHNPNYRKVSSTWSISNPEGYARWFESRMRQARQFLESRAAMEKVLRVDDLPFYRWKTPLQRCVQIFKRHRDMMFEKNPDGKPVSVIITTLAARAYSGEADIESAMVTILEAMSSLVNPSVPRVPNPVNPVEDFTDKWIYDTRLEDNFWNWLKRAQEDYGALGQSTDLKLLSESALQKFGVHLDSERVNQRSSLLEKAAVLTSGVAHTASDGTIGGTGVENRPHKFYG